MSNRGTRVLVALLAAVLAQVMPAEAVEPPLLVTLELERAQTLPGIPVGMRFTAFNRSSAAIEMPYVILLEVTAPDGQVFFANWGMGRAGSLPRYPQLDVAANRTSTFLLPVNDHMTDPAALVGPRLFAPGVYRLRAGLDDRLDDQSVESQRALMDSRSLEEVAAKLPGMVITNAVMLRVNAPSGVDAAAWNLIFERSKGEGWLELTMESQVEIALAIWDRHRDSQYAPYVFGVLPVKSGPTGDQIREQIVKIDRNHPVLDWFDLADAERLGLQAGNLVTGERNLTEGLRRGRIAREKLAALLNRTKNDVVRLAAEEQTFIPPEENMLQWDRLISSDQPPPPANTKAIRPLITCSKTTGHSVLVTFGYENPNTYPVTLPIGPKNRFDPLPDDQRQPTTFLPGLNKDVVTLAIETKKQNDAVATLGDKPDKNPTVAWILDGVTLAPSKDDPKCKEKDD